MMSNGQKTQKEFSWYFYELQVKAQPLSDLMPIARKVVDTKDWCVTREEMRQVHLLLYKLDEIFTEN